MSRVLAPAPASFVDPSTRAPAFGSYAGALPRVTLGGGALKRFAARKRWLYVALAGERIWASVAVVRTGYAATAFAFAYDLHERRMLADVSTMRPTAFVADDPHERGTVARFGGLSFERTNALHARGSIGPIAFDVALDAAPRIAAIADLGAGCVNGTEKEAPCPARGSLRVHGQTFDVQRGGWDYTQGLLPRRTRWRWAFGLGEDAAFNLVSGFVGEAECALFFRDRVVPLAEPRFVFDDPRSEWRLEGEGIALRFQPGAMHAEYKNLGLVRSRFVQPVGVFHGSLGGVDVSGMPGVVEDQDVLW